MNPRDVLLREMRSFKFLTRRDNDTGVDQLLDALAAEGYDLRETR